jgi:DNA integrity scanning protein DisA with diadenylate cyclase activity
MEADENDAARDGGHHAPERVTRSLVNTVGEVAEQVDAAAIFVYLDAVEGERLPMPENYRHRVVYVSKSAAEEAAQEDDQMRNLRVPAVPLTRMGQVKIATFIALSRGLVQHGDVVVFLTGVAGSSTLDTLLVTEVGREKEMLASFAPDAHLPADLPSHVLERVISLAVELGREGREGKPLGVLFVVGDAEGVLPLSRQLIINPFRGYPREERNILDEGLEETIKELATVDGAFIIDNDGTVESCGALLKTASQGEHELPSGLGARHHAAAAITSVTDSVSVTVSESTGTVTVFSAGRPLVELERAYWSSGE